MRAADQALGRHGRRRPARHSVAGRCRPAGGLSAASPLYALRIARRELRGGIRGLRVFLACLVLGVTAIAGIGSLAAAVVAGIKADARDLLGGDAEARLTLRPADTAERAFLSETGQVSEIATMRAMVRTPNG